MPLICRKCSQPADAELSRREYQNEFVAFVYAHRQDGGPPVEHQWLALAYAAESYVREDKERARV